MNKFKKTLAIVMATVMIAGAAPAASYVGLNINTGAIVSHAEQNYIDDGTFKYYIYKDSATGTYTASCDGIIGDDVTTSNITIPDTVEHDGKTYNVTAIEDRAFGMDIDHYEKLQSVTIGNNVKMIGWSAFKNCVSLKNVIFGKNVEEIGILAFAGCTLDGMKDNKLVIPDTVTRIGGSAFCGCEFEKLEIGSGIKSNDIKTPDAQNDEDGMGSMAFADCKNLKEVTIKEGMNEISQGMFAGCSELRKITIPTSVKKIEYWAFDIDELLQNEKDKIDIYYNGTRSEFGEIKIKRYVDDEIAIKNLKEKDYGNPWGYDDALRIALMSMTDANFLGEESGQVLEVKLPASVDLNYKKSTKLTPEIIKQNGVEYTVEWKSSNPKVATVDKDGNVTATKRGKGTATITCTVTNKKDGKNVKTAECTVNVSLTTWQKIIVYVLFGWIWY